MSSLYLSSYSHIESVPPFRSGVLRVRFLNSFSFQMPNSQILVFEGTYASLVAQTRRRGQKLRLPFPPHFYYPCRCFTLAVVVAVFHIFNISHSSLQYFFLSSYPNLSIFDQNVCCMPWAACQSLSLRFQLLTRTILLAPVQYSFRLFILVHIFLHIFYFFDFSFSFFSKFSTFTICDGNLF